MTSGTPAAQGQAKRAGAAGAGLVTYKTTVIDGRFISFAENEKALRRIKRLKRSVWASGHLHGLAERGHRPGVPWFVTLTYEGVNDWQPEHIKESINAFRRYCKRQKVPCRYTWVAELQGRGAVHYHLIAWLPKGVEMPFWDKDYTDAGAWQRFGTRCAGWSAFWPHGSSETEKARAGIGYLMKYLSKLGEFHRFPKGLRLYGIGGLEHQGKLVRAWLNLPGWCKPLYGVGELARRSVGLVVRASGEILESAFRVRIVPGGLQVCPTRELPPVAPEFDRCGAYSSVSYA